jgi:hypothetical protein
MVAGKTAKVSVSVFFSGSKSPPREKNPLDGQANMRKPWIAFVLPASGQ